MRVSAEEALVKAAGRTVTLDPVTSISLDWWNKAGRHWQYRNVTPPNDGFYYARKQTTADAEGRFKFSNLSPGEYYVRTEVTWTVGDGIYSQQGGLVASKVEVKDNQILDVVLSTVANA